MRADTAALNGVEPLGQLAQPRNAAVELGHWLAIALLVGVYAQLGLRFRLWGSIMDANFNIDKFTGCAVHRKVLVTPNFTATNQARESQSRRCNAIQ